MMPRALTGWLFAIACIAGCGQQNEPSKRMVNRINSAPERPQDQTSVSTIGSDLGNAGGPVELDKITLSAPEGWNRREPRSSFVLAEFYLPGTGESDKDGRLTVSAAGGDIESNIERWRTQFGGNPEKEARRTIEASDFQITLVDFAGEFSDQRGPFAPASKQPGARMLAAIIPIDGELFFVKAVGPEKTIAAHEDKILAFFESVKKR
jgi:hypothetical protein